MDPIMVLLRLAHIGAGVFWVGAAFTMFLFVEPTLKALGDETEKNFMQHINRQRKFVPVIIAATFVTVGARAALYWISSDGLNPVWLQSGFGIGITIGAFGAIAAFVIGLLVFPPSFARMEKLGMEIGQAGGPPTSEQIAEMTALGRRIQQVGKIDLVLLTVAVAFMATARYF